jgi:hypothetical protein
MMLPETSMASSRLAPHVIHRPAFSYFWFPPALTEPPPDTTVIVTADGY